MQWKKIAENFNRLSRAHQRHRQTDRQTTDGIATAISKRNVIRWRLLKMETRHPVGGSFGREFSALNFSDGKWAKSCIIYLTKNFGSLSNRAQICQIQPQTFGSQCSRFHPNRFTFSGVIADREQAVLWAHMVNPCFPYKCLQANNDSFLNDCSNIYSPRTHSRQIMQILYGAKERLSRVRL